ncbi:50S ribosomal protein L29 [Kocuria sp. KSNUG]|uniref:50S ribosomal protein L29 n=1 Tax=Kocuria sp. KSNUG TaxID=3136676 RepID=UPI003C2D66FB
MAIGSKDLNMDNLAALDTGALTDQLRKSKEELFNLRFQAATGQLESNSRLKSVKRDIARIYTVLRERELGIREDVALAAAKTEKKASKKAAKSEGDAK